MRKKLIAVLLIFSFFNLHASLFGEENATLSAILTEEILQGLNISTQVQQIYHLIESANKALEVARATKRLYDEAKSYTKEDLLKNSLKGFCEGWKNGTEVGCGTMLGAMEELKDNADFIVDADKRFWGYKGYWENQSDDFMARLVKGVNRTYIFHKVAPNVSKARGFEKHDSAQDIIMSSLVRSGLYNTMRLDNFSDSNIMEQVKIFAEDVGQSKNIVARGLSTLQAQTGSLMKNSTRLKQIEEKKVLDKEKDAYNDRVKTDHFLKVYNEVSKESTKKKP